MNDRTKLADELRAAGAELDNDPNASMRDALIKIDLITNGSNHGYEFSPLFDKLADIIDPTCHNFGGEEGTNGENYDFACSACGYCGDMAEPKYCPNCGARVVDDN